MIHPDPPIEPTDPTESSQPPILSIPSSRLAISHSPTPPSSHFSIHLWVSSQYTHDPQTLQSNTPPSLPTSQTPNYGSCSLATTTLHPDASLRNTARTPWLQLQPPGSSQYIQEAQSVAGWPRSTEQDLCHQGVQCETCLQTIQLHQLPSTTYPT